MKSVLLHVSDDMGQEARLMAALAIVRQHGAQLSCIQVTPMSDFVAADPFGGMYDVQPLFELLAKQASDARARIEARLSAEGIAWKWSVHNGNVAGIIVQQSALTDLIVLSQADAGREANANRSSLAAEVAIYARTAVLAVPIASPAFDPVGVVIVAWNGSPEVAHAVRAALPMLKQSSAVQVITFDEGVDFPTDNIRHYLAAHSVKAECAECRLDGKSVSEALSLAVKQYNAAYIVMGAYGHSRFHEAILGGVSRDMLAQNSVPLLLAH